jgi:hypothetical protein
MAYGNRVLACALVGVTVAAGWAYGCATVIGADDYQIPPSGGVGSGNASTVTTSTTTGAGGSGGGTGACSGATPAGQKMCGPGKTCNTSTCGPPIEYDCFVAGSGSEGSTCTTKADCGVGMTCLSYSLLNVCRVLCTIDTDCPAGYRCSESFTCGFNTETAGKYCAKPCSDVVTPAGSAVCGTALKCNFRCDTLTETPLSPTCDFEAGTLKSGPCTLDDDCAAGYYCLRSVSGDAGSRTCTQACRTNVDCVTGACSGTISCGNTATTYRYCR